MKHFTLLSCAIIAMGAATGANAGVFDFSSPTGDVGTSHTYTSGSLTTTLTAFGTPAAHLFGKADGGDENGVGMTNDTTGDHEIQFGKGFIQVDTLGLTSIQFSFGSTTEGEQWSIYGSNSAGVLGSLLVSGSGEGANTAVLTTYRYYDVLSSSSSGGGNVLLRNMTGVAAVPEPATWAMLLVGFGGVGAILRRRRSLLAEAVA